MSIKAEVGDLSFELDLPSGGWQVHWARHPGFQSGPLGCRLWSTGAQPVWDGSMTLHEVEGPVELDTIHGRCSDTEIRIRAEQSAWSITLQFRLPMDGTHLMWRVGAANTIDEPQMLRAMDLLVTGSPPPGRSRGTRSRAPGIRFGSRGGATAFFVNGWQSWSFAGSLAADQRQPRSWLGPLMNPRHHAPGVPYPWKKGHFTSDFFGVLLYPQMSAGLLLGSLSACQMFASMQVRLDREGSDVLLRAQGDDVKLPPGGELWSDWIMMLPVDFRQADPIGTYLDGVARECGARVPAKVYSGWGSWYQFYDGVSAENVRRNADFIAASRDRLPLQIVQIDDGYESQVGDWDDISPGFGAAPGELAAELSRGGLIPGLWLAPFVASRRSKTFRTNPAWVLRGHSGRPVNMGFAWGHFPAALDVSHPEVQEYACEAVRRAASDWGFPYLKLDFLYAGAMGGVRHNHQLTRAQAFHQALEKLRQGAGQDCYLLGCGCPIGAGVGIFDAMRIGPDVSLAWYPSFPGIPSPPRSDPEFPATRNALRNALARSMLHQRWWVNDPDCVLVRSRPAARGGGGHRASTRRAGHPTRMSAAEVQTLLTVTSLTGGALIVSDDLPSLNEERVGWLDRLLPLLPGTAETVDWEVSSFPDWLRLSLRGEAGEWVLVAAFNWRDLPQDVYVPGRVLRLEESGQSLHVFDFWKGKYARWDGDVFKVPDVPAHGVACLAVRPQFGVATWVGDTLHISQGLAVRRWSGDARSFRAELEVGSSRSGRACVHLPGIDPAFSVGDQAIPHKHLGGGVYCLEIDVPSHAILQGRAA